MGNDLEARIRQSFEKQAFMQTLGGILAAVSTGEVTIELPFRQDLCQQHGFLHAGAITTIVDTACGYAALTVMPPEAEVVTVEFKTNFMAPAVGDRFVARGRVVKSGRTLTITQGDVFAVSDGQEKHIVAMQATMMVVRP